MKNFKKMLSAILILTCGFVSFNINANAQNEKMESILTEGDKAEGILEFQTKGQYLQEGQTIIGNAGKGKVNAGGNTTAQKVVDEVKIAVIIEQYNNGSWSQVYTWREVAYNDYVVSTSKTLEVPRGYYYRARGIHSANTDVGNSFTNGIWMG
jgi:hypothetical protein